MSEDLGRCLAEYKASSAGLAKAVAIMLASLAVGVVLCGISVRGTGEELGGRVILFVLGLLFFLPALLVVHGLARGRNNALRVHERGIVVHHRGTDRRVAWDDVASYTADAFLRIETKSDDSIVFGLGGLSAIDEITARLREEVVLRRWLPKAQEQLRDGNALELGGVAVDDAGVTPPSSDKALAWAEILECGSTQRGTETFVVLKTATQTFEAAVDLLSDRELLTALLRARK